MKKPVDGNQSMTGSALVCAQCGAIRSLMTSTQWTWGLFLAPRQPDGLRDSPEVHRAWAKYFSKWITAYEKQGVPIWAVTPQNEPLFAAPWEACAYTATSEAAFIRDYLGPELREQHPVRSTTLAVNVGATD